MKTDHAHDTAALEDLDVAVPCEHSQCRDDAAWIWFWRPGITLACGRCSLKPFAFLCTRHRDDLLEKQSHRIMCRHHGIPTAGLTVGWALLRIEPL